mmetsp:Transcript_23215/g.45289  ORF Transcript_23215/g.45289 Transcript_23215/m.45289 type:complete len:84 (-) Transcript_23215:206-457(-)
MDSCMLYTRGFLLPFILLVYFVVDNRRETIMQEIPICSITRAMKCLRVKGFVNTKKLNTIVAIFRNDVTTTANTAPRSLTMRR